MPTLHDRRRPGHGRRASPPTCSTPKIAVFYTGLLPQLVPAGWPTGPSLALLVLIHAAITIVWLSGYVVLLSRARSTFEKPPRVRQALERITGTVLLGFGAKIALEAR